MKIEKQVCSLELAKRLKKLGVKQESLFWWKDYSLEGNWWVDDREVLNKDTFPHCSAFTVAELGELLKDTDYNLPIWVDTCWHSDYGDTFETSDTEADARAKLLLNLLENGLITNSKE